MLFTVYCTFAMVRCGADEPLLLRRARDDTSDTCHAGARSGLARSVRVTADLVRAGTESLVDYQVDDDGVALITWNRPERNNAWTTDLERAYFGQLRVAANDVKVRAIVITGAGRHFCPGTDMEDLSSASNGDHRNSPELREPQTFPMSVPKPIIAAIHGSCAGTGFIQACVSDVRFAEADAKITAAYSRRGIMAEHGIGYLLPALIGVAHALDMLESARVLSGEESNRMGLTRLSEPGRAVEDALAYAREIATKCSPLAVAITKRQVYARLREPLEQARLASFDLWRVLREQGDFKEGVRSFLEHRPPLFASLDTSGTAEDAPDQDDSA